MMQRFLVLGFSIALFCLPVSVQGSWSDNFDSYSAGQLTPQSTWEHWDDSGEDQAMVVTDPALSSPNAVEVKSGSVETDLVHRYTGYTSGQWTMTAMTYIPTSSTAASGTSNMFIMLNSYPTDKSWSIQLHFNLDTGLLTDDYVTTASAAIVRDQWTELRLEIDLDANSVDTYYAGSLLSTHQWADMSNASSKLEIQCVDLYTSGSNVGPVYYDNMSLVPEPATGLLLAIGAIIGLLYRRRR